ncbi:MAG TPA: ZIP family metal transporter [Steroidobacteraceae bacterium]|jgi:zinc transporter ZupT|nr:ZIP family metal transporter [Steroidobacteraceae bacterium]
MLLLTLAIAAFCMTYAGGLLALKLAARMHWVLGFSAGAVVAVAFFDLLPEALELGGGTFGVTRVFACAAAGFLVYLLFDRVMLSQGQRFRDQFTARQPGAPQAAHGRATLFAGSLSLHSFLDGIAIGLAFQASTAVGAVVAIAVLTHDFSDGINTMNVVLRNDSNRRRALQWLLADAIAPGLGIFSTLFFRVQGDALGIILALFSGFFLYIGASDLIPESHRAFPKALTTLMTLLGIAVLYVAVTLAQG